MIGDNAVAVGLCCLGQAPVFEHSVLAGGDVLEGCGNFRSGALLEEAEQLWRALSLSFYSLALLSNPLLLTDYGDNVASCLPNLSCTPS